MRMLTLRRCCLPGGVGRSEGSEIYHNIPQSFPSELRRQRRREGDVEGTVHARCGHGGRRRGAGRGGVSGGDEFRGLGTWLPFGVEMAGADEWKKLEGWQA